MSRVKYVEQTPKQTEQPGTLIEAIPSTKFEEVKAAAAAANSAAEAAKRAETPQVVIPVQEQQALKPIEAASTEIVDSPTQVAIGAGNLKITSNGVDTLTVSGREENDHLQEKLTTGRLFVLGKGDQRVAVFVSPWTAEAAAPQSSVSNPPSATEAPLPVEEAMIPTEAGKEQ